MSMETMKSSELIGQRVTLKVNTTPCNMIYPGCDSLTETIAGVIERFEKWPAGPIGFLRTDDGKLIAFDAGGDLVSGAVEIELRAH